MTELTPRSRRELRAKAHDLHPVVSVGQHGLTPHVLHEIDVALRAHGLVKVRVFSDDRAQRETMLAQIAGELDAAPVQHLGKVLILWRKPEEAPKAEPRATAKPRKERGGKGAKRASKDSAVREPRAGPATRRRTTDPTYNDRTRARTSARDERSSTTKRSARSENPMQAPDARRRRSATGGGRDGSDGRQASARRRVRGAQREREGTRGASSAPLGDAVGLARSQAHGQVRAESAPAADDGLRRRCGDWPAPRVRASTQNASGRKVIPVRQENSTRVLTHD